MAERQREMSRVLSTNIIEATDPKDRPAEAVAQLRDIAEWLRAEGEPEIADSVDEAADDVVSMYPEVFDLRQET